MNFCVIMFIAQSSVGVSPLGASSIVVRENMPGMRERIRFHETTRRRNFKKEFLEKSYPAPWHAVAHEAIKNSHRVISPTTTPTISTSPHHSTGAINAASKASTNIATRSKKPPINLRILNFSESSKAIAGWGDVSGFVVTTGNMLSLTTYPPSPLSEASFVRLSTPITSPSSSSSASSSSASSSSPRLSKLCNKLTLDSQPFFNAPLNKRTSCRVSESNLSEIICGSFHAFQAFQRHFLAPNKNGKFEFINNNGRRPPRRLPAFSEMGRNRDVSSHGFREPKTLKKGKRDYLVRRKNHKLVSREKTTKEKIRRAWMEGTEKANILRRVRRIRSIESNLKKSIQNDVLYEDYDGNDQERINTEEITTNNRYVDSSQTSSTPILESSDLNVFSISLNISEAYIDLKFKNDNETTQILDETQEDDDNDDPITFWSLPKDLKNLAWKRKPQIFRNLTILPLGMLLIFLVLVILQVSRWCLEDIRESDGPHLNYTYHLSILGGRDYSMYNKSITSRSLCDANIYEVPTKPKQNIYGRNCARKQKHLSRYLLRGNSAPNGASDGLAYGCRGVVELMMKSSAGMLSNRSLASYDCPFVNAEQYSCSAPRLSETPRGSQQTLELSYLHGRKFRAGVAQTGDKKLSGNRKHSKRVSRSLNNFKSEPRLTSNPQQVHHRSRLSTLKKGSSTESASNSSLASLTQQQKKKQQKRWQRQNHPKCQSSNTSNILENSYYGQTLGSLLVMPSRLVVAPMAVASPSATVSTLLSSNSSSAAIPPPVSTIAKETDDIRTRHHSSPASSNSIKAFNSVHHDNNLTKASTAVVKRFQEQRCLEFDLKEGDSTNMLLESDCESLDVELHGERNIIKEDRLKPAICHHLQEDLIEPVNDESSANKCPIRAVHGGNLKLEDHNADTVENNYPSTKRKIPTSASDSSVGKAEHSSCLEEASIPSAFYSYKSSPRRSMTMAGESSVEY